MSLFTHRSFDSHEEVHFIHDRASGMRAIIAIHDTTLGPAIGGCRMWDYDGEEQAVEDALRLSRSMTYKSAMAGLAMGGGKTVIWGSYEGERRRTALRAFGEAVERLHGRYWTGEDVGTSPADMDVAGERTRYVLGRSEGGSGDPSPFTALGVVRGIEVAVRHRLGREGIGGLRVAVQGLGHVGMEVVRLLAERGAELVATDLSDARCRSARRGYGVTIVGADEIFDIESDIFAPCALGGVLNDERIARLRCSIVAGSANNQLAEDRCGDLLWQRDILYAPDYVINAGGLINIAEELDPRGYAPARARARLAVIEERLEEIFSRSQREAVAPHRIADRMAREILAAARERRAAA